MAPAASDAVAEADTLLVADAVDEEDDDRPGSRVTVGVGDA